VCVALAVRTPNSVMPAAAGVVDFVVQFAGMRLSICLFTFADRNSRYICAARTLVSVFVFIKSRGLERGWARSSR